ncbi:hypothetical protein [Persicobacter sp. CCB-QB2]|uniref:hypothetical protein n=1 Tax=Persicobacter sp. CCB-QB2 TaxID=1561025 RepID=UPI0006A9BA16|nr:hypothetical protein [Persicobacter sp. CCB-QB2]
MDCRLLIKKQDLIKLHGTAVGIYQPQNAFLRPEMAEIFYLGILMKEGFGRVFFPVTKTIIEYLMMGKITIRDIYNNTESLTYQIKKGANKAITVIRDEVENNTLFWDDYFTDLDPDLLAYPQV